MRRVFSSLLQTVAVCLTLVSLTACSSNAKQAKYVFYFIGDGMGTTSVLAAEMYLAALEGENGYRPLCFTQFPYSGLVMTYSASSGVTDSSAAGTALSSGKKTNNNVLGMLPDRKTPVETVAERAKKAGKGIAIGTSVCIDHATPAAFYAHNASRDNYYNIGLQLVDSATVDFIGGSDFKDNRDRRNPNAVTNMEHAEKGGYVIARGYDEYLAKAEAEKIILLQTGPNIPDTEHLRFAIDQKEGDTKLSEITTAALDFVSKRFMKDGFFMMIEGGRIDQACHGNDAATAIQEILDFDNSIKLAYEFYNQHPDETLIVVCADHETGGMSLSNGDYRINLSVLQNQKMSEGAFSNYIAEKIRAKGGKLTWEEMEQELKENFGFWEKIRLFPSQTARLKASFEETFASKNSKKKEEEYYKVDNFSDLAVQIMSEVAQISWGTGSHSAAYVPLFATGVGSELFTGQLNNTEVPERIIQAAGY